MKSLFLDIRGIFDMLFTKLLRPVGCRCLDYYHQINMETLAGSLVHIGYVRNNSCLILPFHLRAVCDELLWVHHFFCRNSGSGTDKWKCPGKKVG
jgi:hypothetical protein